MEETWKSIVGWEGYYEISDLGRVKSLERYYLTGQYYHKRLAPQKILCQKQNKDGYMVAHFRKPGISKYPMVHVLVAQAFIQNPENKPQVNHKKGIKTDNRATELEWNTVSENLLHSYNFLGRKPNLNQLGKTGRLSKLAKKVIQMDLNGIVIKKWDAISDAARELKLPTSNICRTAEGSRAHCGGFKWAYT